MKKTDQAIENPQKLEEKKEEPVKKQEAQVQTAESKPKTVIWLGPPIKGVVSSNKIFKNGLHSDFTIFCEKLPAAKHLIVPINDVAKARKEIQTKDSTKYICYQKVLRNITKEGENE